MLKSFPRPVASRLRSVTGRVYRMRARTPLGLKLAAMVVCLVVAALLFSGSLATAMLRSYLTGQVDTQLGEVARHQVPKTVVAAPAPSRDCGLDRTLLPSWVVSELTDAEGAVVCGPVGGAVRTGRPLPRLPRLTGVQHGVRILTVSAVSGGGTWRVLVKPVTLADGTSGTLLLAHSLASVSGTVGRLASALRDIGLATVVVIAGVGYLTVRASLRPLREVERTAAKIAAGDLSRRVPDPLGSAEAGRLAGALNTMLCRIEEAFDERAASEERMRRFVADAGHELRTPLTTIRGFAELYRRGAATGEADVDRLIARIRDEAERMGLLVEDLLLLARLDQERPLARAPVDLLALAGDAVHAARALAPERPIRLEVGATDPPPIVTGDDARLRQVLGNLVTNALRHTPQGTPVTVTVATATGDGIDGDGPVAVVTVTDQGPGLSPAVAEHVFERFYRADAARSRRNGGAGLGLAIVAALVARHGGRVALSTEPGAGACFTVELPLADDLPPAEGAASPT